MPFLSQLAVRRLGPNWWLVLEDFVYRGLLDTFVVPAGFTTDFASVPRWVQWLIPQYGASDEAAVVHDMNCVEQAQAYREGRKPRISSRDTDGVFRRMLRESGVGAVKRWLMWTGVRWGALVNPARRAGWWRDAPAVVSISVLAVVAAVDAVLIAHYLLTRLLALL